MGIRVVRRSNRDREFYRLLGPFLARREIEREIGYRLYDDDDKVWYVALDERGAVVGFCAARQTRTHAAFSSAYVVPSRRREGVYSRLWRQRDEEFPGAARAVCTAASLPMFLKHGWREHRRRGRFVEVRRDG
ncbi:MAG: GNAT family N-acetyltransferase [bacterium]